MRVLTDEKGNLGLYTYEGFKINDVKSIEVDTGDSDTFHPSIAKVEVYLHQINVYGECKKVYAPKAHVFSLCPIDGKADCKEHTDEKTQANTITVKRVEEDSSEKVVGYIQRCVIKQNAAEDKKPIIKLQRYMVEDRKEGETPVLDELE
jgi:hypothetical protein